MKELMGMTVHDAINEGNQPKTETQYKVQKMFDATLDAFAKKHGFGRLTIEFYGDASAGGQNMIIREGQERHELLHKNMYDFSKGKKVTAKHLTEYFSRLETTKAASVACPSGWTLHDIDIIKARRDHQVRERQYKLGKDKDLPIPIAKDCHVGNTVMIYQPETMRCTFMKIANVDGNNVVLQDTANGFKHTKLPLNRFKNEFGFNLVPIRETEGHTDTHAISNDAVPERETVQRKEITLDLSLPDPSWTGAEIWELSPVRDAQNRVYENVIINRDQIFQQRGNNRVISKHDAWHGNEDENDWDYEP
jgi:hypothetical protein